MMTTATKLPAPPAPPQAPPPPPPPLQPPRVQPPRVEPSAPPGQAAPKRGLWIGLLAVGATLLAAGVLGFVLANGANSSNDETFAEEVASLGTANPVTRASEVRDATEGVEQAARASWEASQETIGIQQDLTELYDRAVDRSDSGRVSSAKALIHDRAGPLIRRYERSVEAEAAAGRSLAHAVDNLQEVLS